MLDILSIGPNSCNYREGVNMAHFGDSGYTFSCVEVP